MALMEIKGLADVPHVFKNLKKMLKVAWEMDRRLTFFYYLTAAFGALTPVLVSIATKFLIDNLMTNQLVVDVPFVVTAVLAALFLVSEVGNFVQWGLHGVYLDYLFRYKLQNELNSRFLEKVANLDVAYFEDPKAQDLITKGKESVSWRETSLGCLVTWWALSPRLSFLFPSPGGYRL
jgi:ABC-type multidrug transport system fused ATPase/permease subunit